MNFNLNIFLDRGKHGNEWFIFCSSCELLLSHFVCCLFVNFSVFSHLQLVQLLILNLLNDFDKTS